MRVEVVKKLQYAGHMHAVGETVEMTDRHAHLFITLGKARRPEGEAQSQELTEESHGRSRRRYRRRDMQAE